MEKKFYKSGLRPVIREIFNDYEVYYAYQWNSGEFKQDMTYMHQIYFDPSGEVEELSKEDFEKYVANLKKERGLV
jgi:hypothetical protein